MLKVIQALDILKQKDLISDYAIGGAFGLTIHAEPVLSYDVDALVTFSSSSTIVDMSEIYNELKILGAREDKEHIIVGGIPLHILPASSSLAREALKNAELLSYRGAAIKVFTLEYLIAIMVSLSRPKDKERIALVKDSQKINHNALDDILKRHNLFLRWNSFQ